MQEQILRFNPGKEFYTPEGCYITENSNTPNDPGVSIARARIEPGVTTRWHYLKATVERYLILEGKGSVEIGGLPAEEVRPGDVVTIPPECRQRITNTGNSDLLFSCICTPGFSQEAYVDCDHTAAMTPFSLALTCYDKGMKEAIIDVHREDGFAARMPAGYFFREPQEFPVSEIKALENCRGHVLDIGAGTGIHSLALQTKQIHVTAIDISPELVALMKKRGVKDARQADLLQFSGGPFDTLLMLGHGIGLCGTINGLDKFLLLARRLLSPGGQVLLDSTDVARTSDEAHLLYHEANRKAGRYVGEIVMRMEFAGITGPFFHWLHVDPLTLGEHAGKAGFACEILEKYETGEYLARLIDINRTN